MDSPAGRGATDRQAGTLPRPWLAYATLTFVGLFSAGYVLYILDLISGVKLDDAAWALLVGKTSVELIASGYGIAFLVCALAFLAGRDQQPSSAGAPAAQMPRVGIIYLCCDDADRSALESLLLLSYRGAVTVVIHDDGRSDSGRRSVEAIASRVAAVRNWDVHVLRRTDRAGGKAGAVNHVLEETSHLYDYFLLCDNDSTILRPDTLQRAFAYFTGPEIAGVQFRSVPVADPGYCAANRRLSESIGAFHAFLAPAARYGWLPFIGHNAFLRTQAVRQVGGLTPDFFSDDLDLTVRLNLAGFRIAYAPDIQMGEKHPPSYTAFRKRSYKWAYGCVQTLRAHGWSVLTRPEFSVAEKLSFFQFAGFYCLQCLLLGYLCFALIAVPLRVMGTFVPLLIPSIIVGLVMIGLVYAPLLSFYLKTPRNRHRGWIGTLILCGLVYGGADFSVLRGVLDALFRRRRVWIPTNGVRATAVDPVLFLEATFGLALLAIPIAYLPELLYLPCWFLFAGKFLFGPALSILYRDDIHLAADDRVADVRTIGAAIGAAEPRSNSLEQVGV